MKRGRYGGFAQFVLVGSSMSLQCDSLLSGAAVKQPAYVLWHSSRQYLLVLATKV